MAEKNSSVFCSVCGREINTPRPIENCPNCCCTLLEVMNSPPESDQRNDEMDCGEELEVVDTNQDNLLNRTPPANLEHSMNSPSVRNLDEEASAPESSIQRLRDNFVGSPNFNIYTAAILELIILLNYGPAPLAMDKIKEISSVFVSEPDIKRNSKCVICFENFHIGEAVCKLKCEHIFHKECIIPWLKLHATCPVCRQNLNDGMDDESRATGFGFGAILRRIAAHYRDD